MEFDRDYICRLESLANEVSPRTTLPLKSPRPTKPKPKATSSTLKVIPVEESIESELSQRPSSRSSTPLPSEDETDSKKVPCPVCRVAILEKNVNSHLDKCLTGQPTEINATTKKNVTKNRMKTIPLPVFHLLKDSDIKKRLKDHGLQFKGDRNVLTKRLKNFIVLWNSQCDLENPLTKLEIVMKVQRDENKLSRIPQQQSNLNYDAKSDPKVIETQQKAYVEKNRDQFSKLIAKARASKANADSKNLGNDNEISVIQSQSSNLTKDINNLDLTTFDSVEPSTSTGASSKPSISTTPAKRKSSDDLQSLSKNTPKRSHLSVSKQPCPICDNLVPESLIQHHVERCLSKPQTRKMNKKPEKEEEQAEEENNDVGDETDIDMDLLNATPEIMTNDDDIEDGYDEELICSTPKHNKENATPSNLTPSQRSEKRSLRSRQKPNTPGSPIL